MIRPASAMITMALGCALLVLTLGTDASARGLGEGGLSRGGGMSRAGGMGGAGMARSGAMGGGMAQRGGSGFTRSGPAANGSWSPGGGSVQRPETSPAAATRQGQASSRQSQMQSNQQGRQQQMQTSQSNRSQNQQNRQSTYSENVSTRQQGATARATGRQQTVQNGQVYGQPGAYYRPGYYPPPGAYYAPAARAEYYDNHTISSQEAAAVMLGTVAVGAAVSSANRSRQTTQTTALPCAAPLTSVVKGVTYYQCGSSWYNQAYGSNGAIYIPVPPPG